MEIKRFGNHACIVNFEDKISDSIHQQVMSIYKFLASKSVKGLTDLIPAYSSLTIVYNPAIIQFDQLKEMVTQASFEKYELTGKILQMPVCYEMALDQDLFCESTGLTWNAVVDLHQSVAYRVYLIGFLPGFLYMGEVNKKIQLPRKDVPRKKVEIGSVGIAGAQTGIYPMASPGGWNILGRTPVPIFQPDSDNPFPVEVGDQIHFFSISKHEFQVISEDKNYKMEVTDGD